METIITERLILRSPDNNDAQTLLKIHNDMATLKFNAMTKYEFAEMIRDIEREHDMMYCIELKNSNNVIGAVFTNTDRLRYRVNALSLSYYLDCRYYRNGYMYEALQAIIIKLFEQEIDIISARVFKENTASARLLEKLGFQYEGCLRMGVTGYQEIVHDDFFYSILKDEVNLTV